MPDWNTRLTVSYQKEDATVEISPIDSFTPTFTLATETLHSLEATHIGVVHSPQQMTFTMTVRAIGDVAAQLTEMALEGAEFDLLLQEQNGGHDWSFKSLVMSRCVITSAMPSAATIAGAPAATFSGFSLAAKAERKTGKKTEIP
jgi:hypothetical protein